MKSEIYPEHLIASYGRGSVIAVVGAGFTSASCPGSVASSWTGLIRQAATVLSDRDTGFSAQGKIIETLVTLASDEADPSHLLTAASMVRQRFMQDGDQAFANFLADEIGTLTAQESALGKAIGSLAIPVATTNYDHLLEKALETDRTATWDDKEDMMRILRGEEPGVAHLHGFWRKPKSVVFSTEDYTKLVEDEGILFGESSSFAMNTYLFVGMGEGALDPNFANISRHLKATLGTSNHYHYLLCRESERNALEQKFADSTIRPLVYGTDYSDLPGYLRSMASKAGPARNRSTRTASLRKAAWSKLAQKINENRLNSADPFDESKVLQTLVEPTFLPLSHEQFIFEKRKQDESKGENSSTIEPIPSNAVLASSNDVTLVVGEEHGGLTTTLQWLCLKSAQSDENAIPVLLDARSIRASERLESAIRKELNSLGGELKRQDEIPQIVLAIDNLTYRESERFKAFCRDIATLSEQNIYVGCQLGNESEIAALLESSGADPHTVFLGKLGRPEIEKYAVIIAPNISHQMISRVFELIQKEHLPRNPFTVSMILALMLQAASRPDRLQSQTDVLNEYMQLLLSHAGGTLDARDSLSVINLDRVLTSLAREYVARRSGSLPASDCVDLLQALFESLDWIENPIAWLEKLTKMRVLRNEGSHYLFRQSSYLYLYAAKAAVSDPSFMAELLKEPLFFAPVIKHCAALQRDNTALVEATASLLQGWSSYRHTGTVFAELDKLDAPNVDETESDASPDLGEAPADQTEKAENEVESVEAPPTYDLSTDTDVVPFPLHDLAQTTEASQLYVAVDLASTVLRDSDAVSIKSAKDAALLTIMHSWGVLIDLLETDEKLREGGRQIIQEGVTAGYYTEDVAEKILENVHRDYACLFVFNGINEGLRSRKLEPAIARLHSANRIEEKSIYATTAAAFYSYLSRRTGGTAALPGLIRDLGSRWISLNLLSYLIRMGYVLDELSTTEREHYKNIISIQCDNAFEFRNGKQRTAYLKSTFDKLDKIRLKVSAVRAVRRRKVLGA